MIRFDPYSTLYKSPFGAVQEGTALTFHVRVLRSVFCQCELLLQKDGEETVAYPMVWERLEGAYDVYTCSVCITSFGLYFYRISLCRAGMVFASTDTFQQTVYQAGYDTPHWIRGGVYYHIFVDRFCKGAPTMQRDDAVYHTNWEDEPEYRPNAEGKILNCDFFGGNLDGIRKKLPYLQSLCVTAIYLSPIFEAYSNHKYDTGDYEKIDPGFGTFEDLERLIREAADCGIRIICDGVFNHTGSDSRYFNLKGRYDTLGAGQSENSPYRDWYQFEADGSYHSWWGIETLPTLKKDHPAFEELILGRDGVVATAIRRGIAGWRLDVADELSNGFLDKMRRTVKSENHEAIIIGEVWEDASNKMAYGQRRRYFQGSQLDSVMNYPFQNAIIDFVKTGNADRFFQTVMSVLDHYPACVVHTLMNTLGTHDTERILTRLGMTSEVPQDREQLSTMRLSEEERKNAEKLLKAAFLIQFTLPGVPCIYYGDEVGMEGGRDPFNRRTFPWGHENTELLEWVRFLGNFRKENSVFAEGLFRFLHAKDGAIVYERYDSEHSVIIGINRGKNPFVLTYTDYRRILGKGNHLAPGTMGIWCK